MTHYAGIDEQYVSSKVDVGRSLPVASPAERPASGIGRAAQRKAPRVSLGALRCAALSIPPALRAARPVLRASPTEFSSVPPW